MSKNAIPRNLSLYQEDVDLWKIVQQHVERKMSGTPQTQSTVLRWMLRRIIEVENLKTEEKTA